MSRPNEMGLVEGSGDVPKEVTSTEAFLEIAEFGVDRVEEHPACDVIHLGNRATLTHWKASEEDDSRWVMQTPHATAPRMALRPDHKFPEELDDIVVENVTMFRAECMSDRGWWMACYFANGQRIAFSIDRATKPARIAVTATELPPVWTDIDKERRP